MDEFVFPVHAIKGRGAATRIAHRFERDIRRAFDDGWSHADGPGEDRERLAALPATEIIDELAKSAISRNTSPDIPFDRSVNPYRGCEHGCVYCFARPTHSLLNLSPGLDFETKIIAKRNIAEVLRSELGKAGYQPRELALGVVTDCYQPIERELRLTRSLLELLCETRHPFALITKSSGIERDLDLIAPMAAERRAAACITITTLDAQIARTLEPRAAAPHRRLRTIRALADAGVPVGVSVAPQIPFVTDDMEQVLAAARDSGASRAFYTVLRLPWEVAPLFRQWLQLHLPERAERVMARVREMRGGADYDSDFSARMRGSGPWAELIRQRFETACRRLGFKNDRIGLDASAFRPPGTTGQGELF